MSASTRSSPPSPSFQPLTGNNNPPKKNNTMKHKYTDEQLQAAIDEAVAQYLLNTVCALPETYREKWAGERSARLDLIKSALDALPEPEPPTVDGKTPGQVCFEAWKAGYPWEQANQRDFHRAASAVLAAFGVASMGAIKDSCAEVIRFGEETENAGKKAGLSAGKYYLLNSAISKGISTKTAAKLIGDNADELDRSAKVFRDVSIKLWAVGEKIKGFWMGLMGRVAPILSKLLDSAIGINLVKAGQQFGDALAKAVKIVYGLAKNGQLWEAIKLGFEVAVEYAGQKLNEFLNFVVDDLSKGLEGAIIGGIDAAITPILKWATTAGEWINGCFSGGILEAIIYGLGETWSQIVKWATDAGNFLWQALDTGILAITEGLANAWEAVVGWATNAGEFIRGMFSYSFLDGLKAGISMAMSAIAEFSTKLSEAVLNGIADGIGWALQMFKDFAQTASELMPKLFGDGDERAKDEAKAKELKEKRKVQGEKRKREEMGTTGNPKAPAITPGSPTAPTTAQGKPTGAPVVVVTTKPPATPTGDKPKPPTTLSPFEVKLEKLKTLLASAGGKGEEALADPVKMENKLGQLPKAVDSLASIGGGGGVSLTTDIAKSQLNETKKTNQLLTQLLGKTGGLQTNKLDTRAPAPNNQGQKISSQQTASPV